MLPPKARQMRFSGSWYYTHVGHFKLYLRHLAQILLILTDFSLYTPVYFVRVYIDWFRISTRRIRDGNVRRRFYSSSNPKLLEGTGLKLLDLNKGSIWDHGVPKCSSGVPEFESGVFSTLLGLWWASGPQKTPQQCFRPQWPREDFAR